MPIWTQPTLSFHFIQKIRLVQRGYHGLSYGCSGGEVYKFTWLSAICAPFRLYSSLIATAITNS